LSWGWSICDATLSVQVELIPKAELVLMGQAEIDLLIIKAGVDLSGSFNTRLIPEGVIDGSKCQVEFDVKLINDPMTIDFESYYATEKCKYWIFDCHWGENHKHTWFEWSLPAHEETLFDQQWKIAASK